ncbi:alpha/beta hydrolase [bacterium]|nr:alpha/beta hydrolase [bacterium]
MTAITHRFVQTNGIRIHVAGAGSGPLVVLLHGFPEGWYSWRHQLAALAAAGYHAVAPDQRGYGRTDRPDAVEAYDILTLTADVVGLVHELGAETAVVVGHDWGAPVAWHSALLRPDVFRAVGLLSVPYLPRAWGEPRPTEAMRALAGEGQFYQLYFQEPGRAEAELEADVRRAVTMFLYAASGDAPPEKRWRFLFGRDERLLDTGGMPDRMPDWLTEADLNHFTDEFTRTGFRGALNWYRNIDRMWETTRFLCGAKLRQPALFAAGEQDAVVAMYRAAVEALPATVPDLRVNTLLPGAGHWVQQERPAEVNELLLRFLARL